MLETLQPPLAIYSSVWLPLILERNTLLNYWLRFPLPLLIPLHFIVTVYFPEDLPCVTSVFFPRNNKIGLSRPFLIFFFLECDHSQHTSLWIFWTLSSFMTCSIENQTLQLKVYLHLPDFSHLAANILLYTPSISPWEYDVSNWHSAQDLLYACTLLFSCYGFRKRRTRWNFFLSGHLTALRMLNWI